MNTYGEDSGIRKDVHSLMGQSLSGKDRLPLAPLHCPSSLEHWEYQNIAGVICPHIFLILSFLYVYMCMYLCEVCVDAGLGCLSQLFSTVFFESAFLSGLGVTSFSGLPGKCASGILLFVCLPRVGITGVCHHA